MTELMQSITLKIYKNKIGLKTDNVLERTLKQVKNRLRVEKKEWIFVSFEYHIFLIIIIY